MTKKNLPSFNELVEKRCEPFEGDVQIEFIMRHKVLKYSVKKAAEEVGISNSYGHKLNKLWAEDPKFRSRIMKRLDSYPDDYKDACRVLLPTILKAEVKALQTMNDNPELAVKHPQLLKQMKQAAGIDLNEMPAPVTQNINIEALGQIIMNTLEVDMGGDADVIDGEVAAIEDKAGEGQGSD